MGLREWFTRAKILEPEPSKPVRQVLPGVDVRAKAEGDVVFSPMLQEILTLFDGSSASYGAVYRKLPPVRTVVDFIADSVATTPLKLYRRTENGRPEDRDHRIARLIRRPNPNLTTRSLIWNTVADRAVYGRAYWRYVAPTRSTPESLIPIPPYRVTPKGGDLVAPTEYEVWNPNGGNPTTYSQAEIIDFHGYNPEDRRIGASKLQALKAVLQEEVEASRNRSGFWSNAARVGGWYFPDEQLTDDQRDVLMESMKERLAGAENAGKIGIVPYPGKFQGDAFSPRDASFIEGRLFVLEATARIYNLPLPLLSLTTSVAYASQREHKRQLYTEVLPPWYEEITSEIELQLFPWFTDTEDLYAEFVAEAKLQGDFIEQAEIMTKAIGRPWMVVREGRNLMNLEDRGVEADDELAVPVGPNLALEGMSVAMPAQVPTPALQVAAAMPEDSLRRQLVAFFDRQERSVVTKAGAGKPFSHDRWNRELGELLEGRIAERVNLRTAVALAGGQDPREVFDELRGYAAEMARAAMSQEVAG
jgi:HK97 family phage portal protein